MTTLSSLRTYIRTQTDTLDSDLPSATIDNYLLEAFNRTIALETNWPFFESTWTGNQVAGDSHIPMPSDCEDLVSVRDPNNENYRLTQISTEEAEDQYFRSVATAGSPVEYSIWMDNIQLWPQVTFSEDRSYTLRGYRSPTNWIAGVATVTEPDCDERLHLPLCHFAIALAYAQQEDAERENVYMERWQRDVELIRSQIMDPRHHLPLVMGPHRFTRIGQGRYRPPFTITTP